MVNDRLTVLIVDDEPLNLEVLESYLDGAGYAVRKASSGEEALKAVSEDPPDIVLLDIMMPGMDGFEVCRRLKDDAETRFIPVVMVTALDEKGDRIAAIEAGADDFITKPVDKLELLARVRSLLRIKSLHDEIEEKYREVVELQGMKDNLMQMLVHDFRNPLTGLMGYLELMQTGLTAGTCDHCKGYIESSRYLAKRMAVMVGNLLDLARLEEGTLPLKVEKTPLWEIVEENIREFRHGISEKGLGTKVEEEPDDVWVTADRALIARVVGNLLANAIRHSPEGGRITFRIRKVDAVAELSISDEGPGIPTGAIDRIFEKFYQAEAKGADSVSGAGIGLAFCRMAVEAHGGSIAAENDPVKGCRFTVRLPLV